MTHADISRRVQKALANMLTALADEKRIKAAPRNIAADAFMQGSAAHAVRTAFSTYMMAGLSYADAKAHFDSMMGDFWGQELTRHLSAVGVQPGEPIQ